MYIYMYGNRRYKKNRMYTAIDVVYNINMSMNI